MPTSGNSPTVHAQNRVVAEGNSGAHARIRCDEHGLYNAGQICRSDDCYAFMQAVGMVNESSGIVPQRSFVAATLGSPLHE